MANPLMQNTPNNNIGGPLINKLYEFAKNYKGDPCADVMKLIETGKISITELQRLKKQAQQLLNLIK